MILVGKINNFYLSEVESYLAGAGWYLVVIIRGRLPLGNVGYAYKQQEKEADRIIIVSPNYPISTII